MTSTDKPEPQTQNTPLVQKLEIPLVPTLRSPHYSSFNDQNSGYNMLGHCLRANIFPGPQVTWCSLVKDSYLSPPVQSLPHVDEVWHGRKTDDMMRWTERNIINQKLQKALKEMEQKDVS
ncbi:ciliary microtubule inner protein 4 [Hoplias malabaricus]|uniref:ciliary microtubule inner protein 4 n=1 Tax=Hoplias malabaricus TaxID=27720 RepID=UPI003462539A